MATKPVQLKSIPSGEYSIEVDYPLVKASVGDTLKFINQLNGHPDVTINFFWVDDAGAKSDANGLCDGVTGNTLQILGAGNVDCDTVLDGQVKYDVSAANHTKLDPVVIIDQHAFSASLLLTPVVAGTIAAVAVVALYAGYKLAGYRMRKSNHRNR